MLSKEEAEEWARSVCENGTYPDRTKYMEKFGSGELARFLWNNSDFTYGMEYGILLAVKKIFGELE